MTQARVKQLLENHLESSNAGLHPIWWPNTEFEVRTGIWLEPVIIPAQSETVGIQAKGVTLRGIFQINIHYDVGGGSQDLALTADEVAGWFPLDLTLQVGGFMLYPVEATTVYSPVEAEDTAMIPVSFEYEAH